MNRPLRAAAAALLVLLPSQALAGITIKMATLAPEGTAWYKALREVGDRWAEVTDGEVQVKIYAGGVVGNETVMLRKMRIGQLHAGAITGLSLLEIDPSAQVINTPMLIRNNDELDYVMDRMQPEFEQRIADGGYKVLAWSETGWVRLFSKVPVTHPDQAGQLEIFVWEGDPAAAEMFRKSGFQPRVVAATDVLPSLQSGLINSFPSTPLGALSMQWFALAPHMLDLNWAPLIGATIITQDAWDAIPAKYHEELLAISRQNGEETKAEVRRMDRKAIEAMKQYGLQVHEIDAETRAAWEELSEEVHPIVREKMVGPEVFDKVVALLEEYRARNP